MLETSQRRRGVLTTLALASIAVGYVAIFFVPGQNAIGNMRSDLHEKQQYIIEATRLTYAIRQSEKDIEAAKSQTERWRAGSPSRAKLSALFGKITHLAGQSGISITRWVPYQIRERNAVWQMQLDLEVEGYFEELFEFTHGIEQFPATIWVTRMDLEINDSILQSGKELAKLSARKPELFQNSKYLVSKISLIITK